MHFYYISQLNTLHLLHTIYYIQNIKYTKGNLLSLTMFSKSISQLFAFIILLAFIAQIKSSCHYTCYECATQLYTSCIKCNEGQLLVVQDPELISRKYRKSNQITGVCGHEEDQGQINIYGIVLISLSILLLPIVNTDKLFFLISTLQTLSLVSFIQVSWMNPLGYCLMALRYYMPFNLMTNNMKPLDSLNFKQHQFYHLDNYFKQPYVMSSLSVLGIIDIIIFALIIIVPLFHIFRRKFCADSCRVLCLTQWFLEKLSKTLVVIFFFLIQQTMLSILVGLQFQQPISSSAITICVVYLVTMLAYYLISYRIKIPYCPNKIIQYQWFSKKLIYPIFLIIPIQTQYILFIMILINTSIQILFDYCNNTYPLKDMYTLYRANQLILEIMLIVYYFMETTVNERLISTIIGGICFALLNLLVLLVVVESVIGIRRRFFMTQPEKQKQKQKNKNHLLPPLSTTKPKINQKSNTKQIQLTQEYTLEQIVQRPKREQFTDSKGIQQIQYEQEIQPKKPQSEIADNQKKQEISQVMESDHKRSNDTKQQRSSKKQKQATPWDYDIEDESEEPSQQNQKKKLAEVREKDNIKKKKQVKKAYEVK